MKIGIDFGGVIVKPANKNNPFNSSAGLKIEMPNAISTIQYLIHDLNTEVWIVSKASKSTQLATRNWLNDVKFYQTTGFNVANLKFCAKRSEKLNICLPLEITHFVDDNIEVLEYLKGTIPNLYLFGKKTAPPGIVSVMNWNDFKQKISE